MATPEIKGIDNRGTPEVPFGFVYVDDTRVGFVSIPGEPGETLAAKGWPKPTQAQLEAVEAHLDEKLPNWRRV
jgi:hypothetical protein